MVQGFTDPMVGELKPDPPAVSKEGRNLVLQTVASKEWNLIGFDFAAAFVKGKNDGREVAIQGTKQIQEEMKLKHNEVTLLEGNVYGRSCARADVCSGRS